MKSFSSNAKSSLDEGKTDCSKQIAQTYKPLVDTKLSFLSYLMQVLSPTLQFRLGRVTVTRTYKTK